MVTLETRKKVATVEAIFDNFASGLTEPRTARVRVIALDCAGKLVLGVAIGLGLGIGLALTR
jgi:hypothetical protein